MLEHTLSEEEHNQIVQTIEMFEAITQTHPDDSQSLEILKEAYAKIGKAEDSLKICRRLAEAYFNAGSYTMAMQECEAILAKEPNAPDILGHARRHRDSPAGLGCRQSHRKTPPTGATAAPSQRRIADRHRKSRRPGKSRLTSDDHGDEHLAKFLIVQQLFKEEQVGKALQDVQRLNKDLSGQALAVSLLEELCRDNVDKLEKVLSALIDRTQFAYVPLEYYDLDRQIAPMLPEHLTLGRLFVPFDLVSRTIMVACCNPFRRGRTGGGAAIGRLHGHVVPGPAVARSSGACNPFTGWKAAPNQ